MKKKFIISTHCNSNKSETPAEAKFGIESPEASNGSVIIDEFAYMASLWPSGDGLTLRYAPYGADQWLANYEDAQTIGIPHVLDFPLSELAEGAHVPLDGERVFVRYRKCGNKYSIITPYALRKL